MLFEQHFECSLFFTLSWVSRDFWKTSFWCNLFIQLMCISRLDAFFYCCSKWKQLLLVYEFSSETAPTILIRAFFRIAEFHICLSLQDMNKNQHDLIGVRTTESSFIKKILMKCAQYAFDLFFLSAVTAFYMNLYKILNGRQNNRCFHRLNHFNGNP